MGRADTLARGRLAAERGMVDTCRVRRRTGSTTDDFSGEIVSTYLDPDPYEGKCEIKQSVALPQDRDVGEDNVVLSRMQLKLPTSATGVQVGDEVEILTSVHDPDLPGTVFLIRGPAKGSHITARRFEVTERAD